MDRYLRTLCKIANSNVTFALIMVAAVYAVVTIAIQVAGVFS